MLMANHAVMTYHRNLSFDLVYSFYNGYLSLRSMRRMMEVAEMGYIMHEESGISEKTAWGSSIGFLASRPIGRTSQG